MTTGRNYRIDFLRALSMFLIVIQHYVVWGIKPSQHATFCVNSVYSFFDYFSMECLYLLSCIGVNCFILITGFFMINRYEFRWKSICNLWITTILYSICLYLITCIGGDFNMSVFLKCFFPIWSNQYWFITKYLGLMLLAPFLSFMASKISRNSYQRLLLIMFFMGFYGNAYANGKSLFWMTFVFLSAGYIRLHGVPHKIAKFIKIITIAILSIYTIGIVGIEVMIHSNFSDLSGKYQLHSFASDSPIFFLSLSFFLWTIRKDCTNPNILLKTCVKIAPMILGVYLIHMNHNLFPFIWKTIIPFEYHIPMALHAICTCTIIFILCINVEIIRLYLYRMLHFNDLINIITSKITFLDINSH